MIPASRPILTPRPPCTRHLKPYHNIQASPTLIPQTSRRTLTPKLGKQLTESNIFLPDLYQYNRISTPRAQSLNPQVQVSTPEISASPAESPTSNAQNPQIESPHPSTNPFSQNAKPKCLSSALQLLAVELLLPHMGKGLGSCSNVFWC